MSDNKPYNKYIGSVPYLMNGLGDIYTHYDPAKGINVQTPNDDKPLKKKEENNSEENKL
jgi:hypothetical protein